MAVDPTTSSQSAAQTAATTTQQPSTALGRTRLAENFETFLSLLTTQLKNQDPLSPLDSNQFTQQLVQMSGVEQQLLTNDLLQKLVSTSSSGLDMVGLIGKDARAESATANLANGKANWIYSLDTAATNLKVEVLNAQGGVVAAVAPTDTKAGDHAFAWDGKDANGRKMPDGTYTLRVTATDADGKAVGAKTYVEGTVTAIEESGGKTLLTVGGSKVSSDAIVRVIQAAATPAPTTPTAANSNTANNSNTTQDVSAAG